jgi:hypothetical protein
VDPDELERRHVPARAEGALAVKGKVVYLEGGETRRRMCGPGESEKERKGELPEHAGKSG